MSKKLCKGIRKDGSPCQGNALDQYDGYCIAHGPTPDQAYQWRSEGGKKSSTAARLDKRIPERLKYLHDILETGLKQVLDGTLSPARYNASCRGVKMILDLYRQSDQEMDDIRAEEIQAAAAAYLGLNANLDVLEAADDMAARQNKHRREALVEQEYAEVKEPFKPGQPPEIFLNHKGRRRFGYQTIENTQEFLNELDDELTEFDPWQSDLSEITDLLQTMQEHVEETLSALARDDVAPFDPLTGRAFTKLPASVQTRSRLKRFLHDDVKPQDRLEEQRARIEQLMHKAVELARDEDDKEGLQEAEVNYRQELVEAQIYRQEPEEAKTCGQELVEGELCPQDPEETETYGQELPEAQICPQEPEEAETYGLELVEGEICPQEPEKAETYGLELVEGEICPLEPEESETSGQELVEGEICPLEPEEAQQGGKTLAYIREALKASGVPIESVPANFRWQ